MKARRIRSGSRKPVTCATRSIASLEDWTRCLATSIRSRSTADLATASRSENNPATFESANEAILDSCRALRELSPCPLGSPPYESASAEDNHAQTNPSKQADGDEPRTERHHGHDHGQIVRSGVAAVRAIAASRIQQARRTHPAKSDDPAGSSQRYRNEQTGKDCGKWNPPREQIGAFAAEPVARGCASSGCTSPARHNTMRRLARRRAGPELVDTAPSRRNRTRSNRPP